MIIIFFVIAARAGLPIYLLRERADRVVAWLGDPLAYLALVASMATPNPYLSGVLSFGQEIDFETSLAAFELFRTWLTGEADPLAIPTLAVWHREPSRLVLGAFRTCVHFSFANIHLGVRRATRLYYSPRDFDDLLAFQTALNRANHWPVPLEQPAQVRFLAPPPDVVTASYAADFKDLLNSGHFDLSTPASLQAAASQAIKHLNAAEAELAAREKRSATPATISLTDTHQNHELILNFPGQRSFPVCRIRRTPNRGHGHAATRNALDECLDREGGRIAPRPPRGAAERNALLAKDYGAAWDRRLAVGDDVRRRMLVVEFAAPGVAHGISPLRGPGYSLDPAPSIFTAQPAAPRAHLESPDI